jgi:hypothetical protein
MNLQMRIALLNQLGEYMVSENPDWIQAKDNASLQNSWFTPDFIDVAIKNIEKRFVKKEILENWISAYRLPEVNQHPKSVGLIMAGNLPLVGFHDFLCVFISGNKLRIKPSSKDEVLIKHLVSKLAEWEPEVNEWVGFEEMLKGCDAYMATGSNNSSRYFDYYFSKYPHIIRRNRTSVAILDGNETEDELQLLADDVYLFFGRGCRNVSKIYVPAAYDFIPLLDAFNKYNYLSDHNKYKNNYDYNLAIHILSRKIYMTNASIILLEDKSLFSPISQLNYEFYTNKNEALKELNASPDLQCIIGHGLIPFGQAQSPSISDYADGIDTLKFLMSL